MKKTVKVFLAVFMFLFSSGLALANLDMTKLYKSVFSTDEKPKCVTCHTDKLPKKEDGKHEMNDYGKKLKAAKDPAKEMPDEETFKKVGKNENAEF